MWQSLNRIKSSTSFPQAGYGVLLRLSTKASNFFSISTLLKAFQLNGVALYSSNKINAPKSICTMKVIRKTLKDNLSVIRFINAVPPASYSLDNAFAHLVTDVLDMAVDDPLVHERIVIPEHFQKHFPGIDPAGILNKS